MIDESFCWLIKIGDNVTFAPGVKVFTHDASSQHHIHYTRVGRVEIGDNTFIGAGSIILPNVTIGSNCIIGAGSVVSTNIPDNSVWAGNPAVFLHSIGETISKWESQMQTGLIIEDRISAESVLSDEKKQQILDVLKQKPVFFR